MAGNDRSLLWPPPDDALGGGLLGPLGTLPEPASDLTAQLAALADPSSDKDAMFIAAGGLEPGGLPAGTAAVKRPEGMLVTSNAAKAREFADASVLSDAELAKLLGYTESKGDAVAAGPAAVVQGVDPDGGVVQEQLASATGLAAAVRAAQAAVPRGAVRAVSPQAAVRARLAGLLGSVFG
jgi:hypothetical protein